MALTQVKTTGIADDAVTTDKLANAINTERTANTAKVSLTDNSVTLAKMAGGTDGQIITYDASGDPVAVGPGTDGQVLTSTGAGSPPAFEDLPTSGAALTGSTNDTICTVTGANAIAGEANLTFNGNQLLTVSTDSSDYATLNLDGNAGGLLQFEDNDTLVWEVYTNSTELSIFDRTNNVYNTKFKTGGNVEVTDGDLVIATSGHGIDFSATSDGSGTDSSELLDDYEEGTWTPIMRTTSGTGVAGGNNAGDYTKIGNVVHAHATVHWTSISGTTATVAQVLGLPYTSVNLSNYRSTVLLGGQIVGVHNGNDDGMNIAAGVDANQSFLYITGVNGSTEASYNYTHTPTVVSSGTLFGLSITYIAA